MKILYFINQYPKISHSFIRREIQALEKNGSDVFRVSIRSNQSELIDPLDIDEFKKTNIIFPENKIKTIRSFFKNIFFNTSLVLNALYHIVKTSRFDIKYVFKNFIYFVEGCYLKDYAQDNNIDHIHTHFGTNSTSVSLYSQMLGGPNFSFTVHGPEEFDKPFEIHLKEKINHASAVIAITSFCRSQLYRHCNYSQWGKIKIVHCGLDEKFFTNALKKPEKISDVTHCVNFLTIGRLSEQKGQAILIQAAALLRDRTNNFHINIVGDGELKQSLISLISELNLSDHISLLGSKSSDEIQDLLDSSDVFVLPSFAEGLPVVIMEAYARRVPVLSTYIAGIPELIDNTCGWLIPAGDVEALANEMYKITTLDKTVLFDFGNVGFHRVVKQHSAHRESLKLIEIFNECSQ